MSSREINKRYGYAQAEALERVCEKRHARVMATGASEHDAATAVVRYLDQWLANVPRLTPPRVVTFARSLRAGYAERISTNG